LSVREIETEEATFMPYAIETLSGKDQS
jgi:hypothetical protein